jgi:hypothetical protein
MHEMRAFKSTEPIMVAWREYQATAEFANTKKWARHPDPDYTEGSLWAAFLAGFQAATERAAILHESVDPASDAERLNGAPGAGAMGAVVQYRDMIRSA